MRERHRGVTTRSMRLREARPTIVAHARLFFFVSLLVPLFVALQGVIEDGVPRVEIRIVPRDVTIEVPVEVVVERIVDRLVFVPVPTVTLDPGHGRRGTSRRGTRLASPRRARCRRRAGCSGRPPSRRPPSPRRTRPLPPGSSERECRSRALARWRGVSSDRTRSLRMRSSRRRATAAVSSTCRRC